MYYKAWMVGEQILARIEVGKGAKIISTWSPFRFPILGVKPRQLSLAFPVFHSFLLSFLLLPSLKTYIFLQSGQIFLKQWQKAVLEWSDNVLGQPQSKFCIYQSKTGSFVSTL